MKEKSVIILKVSISLSLNGLVYNIIALKCVGKEKSYLFSSQRGSRILNKNKLMRVDTRTLNTVPGGIYYFGHCLPSRLDEFKTLLFQKVKERLDEAVECVTGLTSAINSHPVVKYSDS